MNEIVRECSNCVSSYINNKTYTLCERSVCFGGKCNKHEVPDFESTLKHTSEVLIKDFNDAEGFCNSSKKQIEDKLHEWNKDQVLEDELGFGPEKFPDLAAKIYDLKEGKLNEAKDGSL